MGSLLVERAPGEFQDRPPRNSVPPADPVGGDANQVPPCEHFLSLQYRIPVPIHVADCIDQFSVFESLKNGLNLRRSYSDRLFNEERNTRINRLDLQPPPAIWRDTDK